MKEMEQLGFTDSKEDSSLFIYRNNFVTMYLLIYVDDIIIRASVPVAITELLQFLSVDFAIKDLGVLHYFLGVEVLSVKSGLLLSQRSTVESLQYLALTRPDLGFAVNHVHQFMKRSTKLHWQAVKRILRYLKHTVSHDLLLHRTQSSSLQAYSDADWAGYLDGRRSTRAYCVFLGLNLIS
ncbi:uncharacterized mitochondrial protein AtMg00810-like [Alnus glutinosa]|uniref:uncharacterized mitochondrial protein AtMg00810-like n=1 Tax=Alnus glutinosa TaxID=3517 RepID=UPI002D775E9D|nr:uncharacterized mitochondrial protein AtMg00810-like [Alnus glutinosa]